MAYFSQDQKAKIAPKIKQVCAKYGVKGSLSVRHSSAVVLTIKSGRLDIIGNLNETVAKNPQYQPGPAAKDHVSVNPYWFKEHYTGTVQKFLTEVFDILNDGNHDRSDIQSDYFDVGWYVDVNVGKWNAPYILTR